MQLQSVLLNLKRPLVQLTLLACASTGIYAGLFVRPYSLAQWWSQPGLSIAKITHYAPDAGALFVVAMLLLFLLYWLACRIVMRFHGRRMWAVIIASALAFNVVMLALYPVDAADIFDYMIRARMQIHQGANPFYDRPDRVPGLDKDPTFRYAGWTDVPTAYGPWWELAAEGMARLAGDGVIANILAFKGLALLAYAGTAAVVALTLRRQAPKRALYGLTLAAWNPLAIYSIAGNGHNDGLMAFWLVLGFYFLARRQYTLAALAEVGGALVKFIPALVFPVLLAAGLLNARTWRDRIRYFVITGLASAAMVAASFAPFWRGGDILNQGWRLGLFTTSLPTLFQITLLSQYDAKLANSLVSRGSLLIMAAWVAWQVFTLVRQSERNRELDWEACVRAAFSIVVFYLLIVCPWFQPWYAIWAISLAALLPDGVWSRGGIVLSLAASFKMPIFDFALQVRPGNAPPRTVREWPLTIGTFLVPWIYFIYQWFRSKLEPEYRTGFAQERGTPRAPDEKSA